MNKDEKQQIKANIQRKIDSQQEQTSVRQPLFGEIGQKKPEKPKIQVQITNKTQMKVPRVSNQNIMCVVIILLIIPAGIIYSNSDWVPGAVFHGQNYDFQVFCPVYYDLQAKLRQERDKTITGWIMQHLYSLADKVSIYSQLYSQQQKHIYIVKIMDGENQTNSNSSYGMRYCGLARPRTGTCEKDAKFICTNPGPIFQTNKDQEIIVIWVNGICKLQQKYQQEISQNLSSCYGIYEREQQRPKFCTLFSKLPKYRYLTYEDPTILPPSDQFVNFTINNLSTPISTYVHGMVVRPSFNGGPLSWFTSKGQVGLGYSTAERQNVDFMRSVMRRNKKLNQILTERYKISEGNYKIDIYPNRQQPGMLLYYDSAVSVMKKNLIAGLSGLYIIRDYETEKQLPTQNFEHQILIHPAAAKSLAVYRKLRKQQNQTKPAMPSQIAVSSLEDYILGRETYYRFRIANADFAAIYHNLRFVYTNSSQNKQNKQTSKNNSKFNTSNQTKENVTKIEAENEIEFWIVGTDSSLKNIPLGPYKKFDYIAPAERFDILIKFSKQIPSKIVKMVYGAHHDLITTIYLSDQEPRASSPPLPTEISAPYFNFSIFDDWVVRRRMRPFTITSDNHIATNGHLTLFEGKSQNPMLGTVQDWYFINNINTSQSMHIDLVQFQTLDQYSLNMVPNTEQCTFYAVDFFMKYAKTCQKEMKLKSNTLKPEQFSGFVAEDLVDYENMCRYINGLNKSQYSQCFKQFANEHDDEGPRHLSGLDVQEICQSGDKSAACTYAYKTNQTQAIYKYRGEEIKISQYRKGFKDIQVIPKFSYSRLRIRWTRNDFPEEKTAQNQRERQLFFFASEQQLSEYPGYTYRSTRVVGEESHMMRPIMVQPHSAGRSKPWKQIYEKINGGVISHQKTKVYTSWHDDDDYL